MKTQEQIRAMVRDAKFCMFSTVDTASGKVKTRPMSVVKADELNQVWFFTADDTEKVSEMKNTWEVALGFSNEADHQWVAVNGPARLVKDKEKIKDLWNPMFKAWFPQGLDTPNLALICVEMQTAEYWESHGGSIANAFEMIKAAITGDPAHNSEHAIVNM